MPADPVADLDTLLSQAHHHDYWSDVLVDDVARLIDQLTADQWRALSGRWRARPGHWQRQIADAASSGHTHDHRPLLVELLGAEDTEAAMEAAACLECEIDWRPQPEDIERVHTLAARLTPDQVEWVITPLLRRISTLGR